LLHRSTGFALNWNPVKTHYFFKIKGLSPSADVGYGWRFASRCATCSGPNGITCREDGMAARAGGGAKAKSAPGSRTAAKARAAGRSGNGAAVAELTAEEELSAYREMLLIRRFEEKAGQMYGMGLIGGFCHLYIGQEAVVVGMQMVAKEGDQIITGYRDHGHMLVCGMDPKGVMAELTGRRGGYSKGKGGSMHMFSVEKGFFGGHGIVGAQVSLGTGLGFANKYRGNDNVSFTYFGDGAANQGQVYESFNMARLWHLPVVYVIENNKYGMGTSVARASATTDLYQRGASFDIPGEQVDGMDVRAVKAAGAKAAEICREGKGPYILEMLTYRYRGHSMSDPAKYRSKDEVQKMRQEHDPIEQVKARLLAEHQASEDALKDIDREVRAIVNEAAEFAQTDPEPDPSELWTDVLR
jgi:pyruvate dehydrogenase E1 component alpha subunit